MHRTFVIAAAAAAACALAACSSSGGASTNQGSTKAGAESTPPAAVSSAPAPQPNTLSVTAYDKPGMRYEIAGQPQAGLVSITFTNAGDAAHEMGVMRMKPGVTLKQVETTLQEKNGEQKAQPLFLDPDAEYPVPSILGPGRAEVDTAKLPAGHYVVACFLPGEHGMPHAFMGMIGEFTVAAGTSAAQPPQTDSTVELTDSGIRVPAAFGTGGTYEVTNTGTKPHDFSVAQLSGKPLSALFQCVLGAFGKGTPIDTCPGTLSGGVDTLQPGESAYLTMTLRSGDYGYVSTQGDGADVQAGLTGTFTVS